MYLEETCTIISLSDFYLVDKKHFIFIFASIIVAKCLMLSKFVLSGKPKGQRRGEKKKRFNLQEKENGEARRERKREREKETIDREDSESRNKTEHRPRRDQSRDAGTV